MSVKITGFEGKIVWDTSKPDGQPKRRLDVSRVKREGGFRAKIEFEEDLRRTIEWYKDNRMQPKECTCY